MGFAHAHAAFAVVWTSSLSKSDSSLHLDGTPRLLAKTAPLGRALGNRSAIAQEGARQSLGRAFGNDPSSLVASDVAVPIRARPEEAA
jgi:hypothetical protein